MQLLLKDIVQETQFWTCRMNYDLINDDDNIMLVTGNLWN